MNIKELENKIVLLSDQIKEYNDVKIIAEKVRDGKEEPTHSLFRCTVDMCEVILNNLNKEMEDCVAAIKSLQAHNANGGYPFGK